MLKNICIYIWTYVYMYIYIYTCIYIITYNLTYKYNKSGIWLGNKHIHTRWCIWTTFRDKETATIHLWEGQGQEKKRSDVYELPSDDNIWSENILSMFLLHIIPEFFGQHTCSLMIEAWFWLERQFYRVYFGLVQNDTW